MGSTFKIGDTVISNHGVAKIKHIEVVELGEKEDGIEVNEFYWSMKNQVVVDLDNGHWAYGATISRPEKYPARLKIGPDIQPRRSSAVREAGVK